MKQVITTPNAPAPIGPYSQAVKVGNLLFLSGQIAINPQTGQLVMDNLEKETIQVLSNIKAILDSAGAAFSNIVKTTIFLSDMAHFDQVNAVYAEYFHGDFPARETVQVAGLPKGVNVEISVIAAL